MVERFRDGISSLSFFPLPFWKNSISKVRIRVASNYYHQATSVTIRSVTIQSTSITIKLGQNPAKWRWKTQFRILPISNHSINFSIREATLQRNPLSLVVRSSNEEMSLLCYVYRIPEKREISRNLWGWGEERWGLMYRVVDSG